MGANVIREDVISKLIISSASKYLESITNVDVVVVGAGPAGLTAAYYLAKKGINVLVIERRISFGGGIGGGGMLFPRILVSEAAKNILDDIGCGYEKVYEEILAVDPVEMMSKLATSGIDAGAKFLLGVTVDDVVYRESPPRISGVVIQWTAVIISGIHVDPLNIMAKAVIDATGHDAEVLTVVSRKIPEFGLEILGEKSMFVSKGEEFVIEKTGRVLPGLYAAGMSVAALYGGPRMGPLFSSMLLSGKKVAEVVIADLSK